MGLVIFSFGQFLSAVGHLGFCHKMHNLNMSPWPPFTGKLSSVGENTPLNSPPQSGKASPMRVLVWRERSWNRSVPEKVRPATNKRQGLTWRERSVSFSASRTGSRAGTSSPIQDVSMHQSEEPGDMSLTNTGTPMTAKQQKLSPQCLLCQMRITEAELVSLEELAIQLQTARDPMRGPREHGTLYRLPYDVIWPGNVPHQP